MTSEELLLLQDEFNALFVEGWFNLGAREQQRYSELKKIIGCQLNKYICTDCSKGFKSEFGLRIHFRKSPCNSKPKSL